MPVQKTTIVSLLLSLALVAYAGAQCVRTEIARRRTSLPDLAELRVASGGVVCYVPGTVNCNQANQGCGGSTSCKFSIALGYVECVGGQKLKAITTSYPKAKASAVGSLNQIPYEQNTCYKIENCSARCTLIMGVNHCQFQSDNGFGPYETETMPDNTPCPGP